MRLLDKTSYKAKRPDQLPKKGRNQPNYLEKMQTNSYMEMTSPPPPSAELPEGKAVCNRCSGFYELSPILGWAWVLHLSLNNFFSYKQPLTHTPLSNSNKMDWFTTLNFGSIHILIFHGIPLWGEQTWCVMSPHEKFCHTASNNMDYLSLF